VRITRAEVEKKLNEINRPDLIESTALQAGSVLSVFTEELVPKVEGIIEIGTFYGIGTVALAMVGKVVYTYDIAYRDAELIWNLFGVRNKIRCCVAPQWQIDADIKFIVRKWQSKLNFNFAFVDGNHTYESVKHDFGLVKFCGRVLFDNVNMPELRRFVIDEIGGRFVDKGKILGYWEEK